MTYSQESRRDKYLCPKVATLPLSTRTSKLPALNCWCSSRVSLWGKMTIGLPSSTNSWTSWKMRSSLPVSLARRPKFLRPVHTLIVWVASSSLKIVKLLRSQRDSKNVKRNIKNFLWGYIQIIWQIRWGKFVDSVLIKIIWNKQPLREWSQS